MKKTEKKSKAGKIINSRNRAITAGSLSSESVAGKAEIFAAGYFGNNGEGDAAVFMRKGRYYLADEGCDDGIAKLLTEQEALVFGIKLVTKCEFQDMLLALVAGVGELKGVA